ncbi:MAG: hypothetical protein QY323_00225 [Patescibacteria group bacterium]|nr:MAG: hypothetical protein QY323_00225 [Patescibacteria group bacterium]
MNERAVHFIKDASVLGVSVAVAVLIATTDTVSRFLVSTQELQVIGSFLAGMCFTSVLTTAPAIVTLGEIVALGGSPWMTAAIGALGAVLGDLLLFAVVRDRLSEHLAEHLKNTRGWSRFSLLMRSKSMRWFSFFVGALVIASPFPDELGVSLLGIAKMRTIWFVLISYTFNFIGILALGGVVRLLV